MEDGYADLAFLVNVRVPHLCQDPACIVYKCFTTQILYIATLLIAAMSHESRPELKLLLNLALGSFREGGVFTES